MQVFQYQQHRRMAGHGHKELRRCVQEPESLLVRLQGRRRAQSGRSSIAGARSGPMRDRPTEVGAEPPRGHLGVPGDRLGERAERGRPPPSTQRPASTTPDLVRARLDELPQRVGLTDPGSPVQQHHPAPPVRRLPETSPADETSRGRARNTPATWPDPSPADAMASSGDCRRIATCRCRSSGLGSTPRSCSRSCRTRPNASRASACRPSRYRRPSAGPTAVHATGCW